MSPRVPLPTDEQIHRALDELTAADHAGRPPSVLALATHLGLANTTFWRHFPDIARTTTEARRRRPAQSTSSAPEPDTNRIAELRRANRNLTQQLQVAMASVFQLTTENHQLRTELETATSVHPLHPTRSPAERTGQ